MYTKASVCLNLLLNQLCGDKQETLHLHSKNFPKSKTYIAHLLKKFTKIYLPYDIWSEILTAFFNSRQSDLQALKIGEKASLASYVVSNWIIFRKKDTFQN